MSPVQASPATKNSTENHDPRITPETAINLEIIYRGFYRPRRVKYNDSSAINQPGILNPFLTAGSPTPKNSSGPPGKKSGDINEPVPYQSILHRRILRDISNTDKPRTAPASNSEVNTIRPAEITTTTNTVTALVKQLRHSLQKYIELTDLGQSKTWLPAYQSANPDTDITPVVTAIDQSLEKYEMVALIEHTLSFCDAIQPSSPEVSQHYKIIIQELIDELKSALNIEPATRNKRAVDERIKQIYQKTLDALAKISTDQLRQFIDGHSEARREFMAALSTSTRARRLFPIADFVGDTTGRETAEQSATRLSQSVRENIRQGLFREAGRFQFRAALPLYILNYQGTEQDSDLQRLYQTLFQENENIFEDLNTIYRTVDLPRLFMFYDLFKPEYIALIIREMAGNCMGATLTGLVIGYEFSQSVATQNFIRSFFGQGDAYSYLPLYLIALLQDLHIISTRLFNEKLFGTETGASRQSTEDNFSHFAHEYYGQRTGSAYWNQLINIIDKLSRTNAITGFPVKNSEELINILSHAFKLLIENSPEGISVTMQSQLHEYNIEDEGFTHVMRIGLTRVSAPDRPDRFHLVIEDLCLSLRINTVNSLDELLALLRSDEIAQALRDYNLPVDTPDEVTHQLRIMHDDELEALASLTPIPYSALTIRDIVTRPIARYRGLEQQRVLELILEYGSVIFSSEALQLLQRPRQNNASDSNGVTEDDPVVYQMREVITSVRAALSENTSVSSHIAMLANHVNSILHAARHYLQRLSQQGNNSLDALKQLFETLNIPQGEPPPPIETLV